MQSNFQLDKIAAFNLEAKFQKASGLNQRDYQRVIGRDAEQKIIKVVQKVDRQAVSSNEDAKRFVLPPHLNPEEHLFNLAFVTLPDKPLMVIDHAFREYNEEFGYWQSIVEESLAQRVLGVAKQARTPATKRGPGKSLGTAANVRKTLDHAGMALFSNSLETSNTHLIAFKNGTVCTKTGDLSPHNPDHYITSGLPYEYRQGAECPEPMLRYIASSFGAENIEYVRAGLGLMLDLTAKDKFIHAIGPSGSGKGVLTRLVMKFFGSESVGSPNNFKLFANPDQVHQYLSGKRLIAIDDIVGFVGEEIGRFYTAVERTAMNARCLFKPKGYTQQFDIRYIVASTGQLPTKYSNSKGWERRVFPMPTTGRQEADNDLERQLEGCIADIISWVLAQDKATRNAILEHPERYNDAAEEYFIEAAYSSSSAWGFIEECLKPVPIEYAATSKVDMSDLYECYKAYCAATGRNSVALNSLIHEFRQAIPANYIGRKQSGKNKLPAHFVYIKKVPHLFETNGLGAITCDTSNLGYDGVTEFRQWAKKYGSLHPYNPEKLSTGTTPKVDTQATSTNEPRSPLGNDINNCNEPVTQNVSDDTKVDSRQGRQGRQVSFLDQKVDVCVSSENDYHSRQGRQGRQASFLDQKVDVCVSSDGSAHTHTNNFQAKSGVSTLSALSEGENAHTHTNKIQAKSGLSALSALSWFKTRMRYSNPEGLTVTWGLPPEEQQFERGLMAAETMEELQQVKACFSEELRKRVMGEWVKNGQYDLLIQKVERLKKREQANGSNE